ncbi:polyunsaturated fatty acid 5-lipoxygenase-like isoform X3 [Heterodontus francisci]|uniref:polyunsaturated fatty acid 5-lipoxygenase-like isoform X3 n=1 Tax=Heterodontus francisci TaxID=7792 RepID=UPI00355BC3A9
MVTYKVTFRTGTAEYAGTDSSVYCTLIGEEGESLKTSVGEWLQLDLEQGSVDRYEISSDQDLGTIWFVQLEVTRFLLPDSWFLIQDYWYCCSVTVETPSGKTFYFPCYKWLDNCTIRLREGTAQRVCDDQLPIFQSHRQDELRERQQLYRWKVFHPNMPRCIDAESLDDLPMDLRFSSEKERNFKYSVAKALQVQQLKKFVNKFGQSWTTVEDFDHIFWKVNSSIAAFARQHWKEDWFFGYQFLNGFNPVLIQKCEKIPANFPVTNAMVKKSFRNAKLEQEMKNGNIFIVNYKVLDGIPANVINGVQQYVAAPICLLYLNKENHIVPIAIQLNQTPGKDNPIFLPSDADLDWLLAKMWVRNADILHFELVSHLLKTHIIAEPFCVATIRQLPSMHPIYKLLIPHVRYTMQINLQSRLSLIGRDGAFSKAFSIGAEGQLVLFSNEFQAMTYQSLCLPENLENRGVKELKDYYYKDDGLLIWSAIHKFVTKIVMFYYDNDQQVTDDPELQAWIKDVTEVGFQDLKNSGIPTSFCKRMELCKFLTMMIFTCSAQHAVVNSGQYDWSAWVPNSPSSMRKPPPKAKGMVIMEHVMESLPDIAQSCSQMALSWVLTRSQPGMKKLGDYEEYFSEKAVKDIIKEFQEELKTIDRKIQERNESLDLKYEYLRPVNIENSITI